MINKVILMGRLCADPELRNTQSGIAVCRFRIAVNRQYSKSSDQKADFINIVAWRQLADLCGRYLSKGRKCAVVGSIQTRTYDAQDGSKRHVTEVVADEVEFLGGPNDGGRPRTDDIPLPPEPSEGVGQPRSAEMQEVDDDELPF